MPVSIEELTRTAPTRFGLNIQFDQLADYIDDDIFAFDAISSGTFAAAGVNGGGAYLAGAATTDNSGGNLQATGCKHNVTAGKSIRCSLTAQLSETTSTNGATESDILFGMFTTDTSLVATLTSAYGVYFRKDEGDTNIDCAYVINGTATDVQVAAGTMDSSEHTYEVRITSAPGSATTTLLEWFIDGLKVASATITTLLSTNDLVWSLAYQTGDNTGTKGILLKRAFTNQEF
jgi:hypothetical protein